MIAKPQRRNLLLLRRLDKLLQFYRFADGVFVLEVGDQRVALDSTDFGGKPAEKARVARCT